MVRDTRTAAGSRSRIKRSNSGAPMRSVVARLMANGRPPPASHDTRLRLGRQRLRLGIETEHIAQRALEEPLGVLAQPALVLPAEHGVGTGAMNCQALVLAPLDGDLVRHAAAEDLPGHDAPDRLAVR